MSASTRPLGELVLQTSMLAAVLDQHIANSPPVPVTMPWVTVEVPRGGFTRVPLDATESTDADSTPGTSDNIVAYRWLDAAGRVLDDRAVTSLDFVHHGREDDAIFELTLELEDAYGSVARQPVTVVLRPGSAR